METNSTYYIDLITRYFSGEATPDQIRELEQWVKQNSVNAETFKEYNKTWQAIQNNSLESSLDLNQEWSQIRSKIKDQRSNPSRVPQKPSRVPRHVSRFSRPASRFMARTLRIAALFLLLMIPAFFLYRYLKSPVEKQFVAGNGLMDCTLPDGTAVTLNAGSTLTYPSQFEGSFRKVTLQGEAWFEVAHDKTKPFIIAAENVRIRVVGTSFFVDTKTSGDNKEIILSTGVVRVYYENQPETMELLLPGDRAELASDGYQIQKSTNADINYLAWKTRYMVFNNTPLNEVVSLLSEVYHADIRLSDEQRGDCRITATFDRQSLESVLNVLKATLNLQIRNSGAGIEISGDGCK